jgi:hypothetical protein
MVFPSRQKSWWRATRKGSAQTRRKALRRSGLAVWESPCCGVEKLRSERYGMWHNVAIASVLVKHFISDRYEK